MSLITWQAHHELLDTNPVFAVWETLHVVSFLQHSVIVHLHAFILDTAFYIIVLFMHRKLVIGIALYVCHKATLSVVFPWLAIVIDQSRIWAVECFHSGRRGGSG